MKKTAIILGATGLTGNILLQRLLEDDRYGQIVLFSRNSSGRNGPKVKEYIINLFELHQYEQEFKADEVFCCIGTTKAKTPDKQTYKAIDYGIPVSAARLCKIHNIQTFIVVSALGANTKSSFFYNRIKGLMEKEVLNFDIKNTYILQPSLIEGQRREKRKGEWFFKQLASAMPFLKVGPLKKFQPVPAYKIAKAMIYLANSTHKEIRIKNHKIHEIADAND
ncbi:NAD(P)H-binding protein [Galbibacter sp.]|uniref:NAD(P)H-binding protein n=1 Tax=Galbibacter sp. TaxID=2918471 RepID=UPI002BC5A3BE|nr:NAD(P)H-binding protein [Galbibacter sp.]HLV63738.1 NAD(P)H-binding protein [Galbibacter sp.]